MVLMAIANIFSNASVRIGFRLIDIATYKTVDVLERELYNAMIQKKVNVNNLRINGNHIEIIESRKGSLPDVYGKGLLRDGSNMTVLYKLGDIGIEACDHNGTVYKMGILEANSYSKNFGFSNMIIASRQGKIYTRDTGCYIPNRGYTQEELNYFNKRVEIVENKNKALKILGYNYSIDLDYSPKLTNGDWLTEELSLIAPISRLSKDTIMKMQYVSKLRLPGTLKKIPDRLLINNRRLDELEIEEGVEVIGVNAFLGCIALSRVKLPSTIKIIEQGAFNGCRIGKIELPKDLLFIGKNAFKDNMIKEVIIPDNVTHIQEMAFCRNSIEKVYLGNSVEYIEKNAFTNNEIKKVVVNSNLKSVDRTAFNLNNDINISKFIPLNVIKK